MKKVIRHLTSLGLKETDAQVYLACLGRAGGLHVHEIVERTGIQRSTVDLILSRLKKQGFVSVHKEGARRVFSAEHPERISFSFEQNLRDFQSFMPQMAALLNDGENACVRFFEGVRGIEAVYDDILLTCQALQASTREILVVSSGKDLLSVLPDHDRNFIRKRIRRGIKTQILAPKDAISQQIFVSGEKALRSTRFFDGTAFPMEIEIDLYADKVAFINLKEPNLSGTILQSPPIARSLRSLFMMMWQNAA